MKAFLLAAGFGKRLQPLTLECPKPLIQVGQHPLIVHHLLKLADAGIKQVAINSHWLAEKMQSELGDGSRWQMEITWFHEPELLETGGGLYNAREWLGDEPFLLASADLYSDLDYRHLAGHKLADLDAHLVLVPNPAHNPRGDFVLQDHHIANFAQGEKPAGLALTYSGLAVINGAWVRSWKPAQPRFPLVEYLWKSADQNRLSGEKYEGLWTDVGTPERLHRLRQELQSC